jgi:hypothetical protein
LKFSGLFGIDSFAGGYVTEEGHMPGDRNAYTEHAKRCLELAAEASDPVLKQNLIDAAQRWTRLASDLAATSELLDHWERKPERSAG